jgi:CheY-like chemotaxis protein
LILIVDDDENVLEIATEFVQRLGYNAVVVSNGADALNSLRRNQDVTVLFSDINMPGMDGEELARASGRCSPRAARHSHLGARRRTIAATFVPKPYRAADLVDVLGSK